METKLIRTIGLMLLGLAGGAGLGATPELPAKLDLSTAIGLALANNYPIQEARERIREQEGVEITVRARQLPNVSAAGTFTGNTREISKYLGDTDRAWAVDLQASEVLFAGGGVKAAVKSSSLVREAAVLELQGVINQQLLAVRTQFYTVLLDQQRIKVQEENVRLLQQQLKDAQSRYAAGTTSNFDVLRAEVALANGQPPLIQARNDFRVAVEQMRQLLGVTPAPGGPQANETEFVGSLDVANPATYQLDEAMSAARANRPELQRLVKLAGAGVQNVKAARSAYYPEIDAVGSYTWVRGPFSVGWSSRLEGWTAGAQVSWDIFDGRATAGRVAQARSQLAQAKLSLDENTLGVEVQVRQAYSSLQEAWELVQASGKTVEQAQEALRLANVRYHAGTATQLDVLTSQVALTEARLNQLQANYTYNVAKATMRQAMGLPDEDLRS